MGIPRLTTFMLSLLSKKCFKHEPIQGCLVIDGNNFCHWFYRHEELDWINGGQYWSFKDLLKKFFGSLTSSGINPVVAFDGIDYKGDKETKRREGKTETMKAVIRQLSDKEHPRHANSSKTMLPVLAMEVFRQVLKELKISTYVVDGEADPDIVAIANHYNCPVLAEDSDYFIFDVNEGYIPTHKLEWGKTPVEADIYTPVEANIYTLKKFNEAFGLAYRWQHYMIPAILGNDFIQPVDEINVQPKEEMSVSRCALSCSRSSLYIESIIQYIAQFKTVSDLLKHVSAQTGNQSIATMLTKNFDKAKEIYNITHTLSEEELMTRPCLFTVSGSNLPEWILQQYRRGNFSSRLMEVLVVGQSFLPLVTDDPDQPTAHEASHPIRQSIYGILSPLMKGDSVTEVIRVDDELCDRKVTCSPSTIVPSFPAIEELFPEVKQRVDVLCEVIKIDPAVLEVFEWKWKLVVASGCFWVKECSPSPRLVKSLVLCMVMCACGRDPGIRITEDVDPMAKVGDKQWRNALHQFSRFQCIYNCMMELNNILQNPVHILSPASFFDGKLACFYACKFAYELDEIAETESCNPLCVNLLKAFH